MPDAVRRARTRAITLALVAIACHLGARAQQQRYNEDVRVSRVIVDAHVVDSAGAPIAGLKPDDFVVRIDGRVVRVERVRWIAAGASSETTVAGSRGKALTTAGSPPAEWTDTTGRLIVFVFQRDMEASRVGGLLLMQARTERFLRTLAPSDRVALAWFDSHLKLAADFTTDRAQLADVLRQSVLWTTPPMLPPGRFPSLVNRFDYSAAARAASIEQALEILAGALAPLPGPKAVVLFGWGFGRLMNDGRVALDDDYKRARRALVAARASVFSLDVTAAAAHSLEVGLKLLSEQTGGYYMRTNEAEDSSFDVIARILAGEYELLVEKPERPPGTHVIEVALARRRGTVLARKAYTDQ